MRVTHYVLLGSLTIFMICGALSCQKLPPIVEKTLLTIDVSPTNPIINSNDTVTFTAKETCSGGGACSFTPRWSSDNITCVTIDASTGIATGKNQTAIDCIATITATVAKISGSTTLKVSANKLTNITITPDFTEIAFNDTASFTAAMICSGLGTCPFIPVWISSNTNCATIKSTIDSTAKVMGQNLTTSGCTTNIIASSEDGKISTNATLIVNGQLLKSVVISTGQTTLTPGSATQFSAQGKCGDNSSDCKITPSTIKWASSNVNCAAIDTQGMATGKNYEETVQCGTIIRASVNSSTFGTIDSNDVALTVTGQKLESIDILPKNQKTTSTGTIQFNAKGICTGGQECFISSVWSSDNSNCATINAQGEALGVNSSTTDCTTTITATVGTGPTLIQGSATLNVLGQNLTNITITPNSSEIGSNGEIRFSAQGVCSGTNCTIQPPLSLTWTSTKPDCASIDQLTGKATGTNNTGQNCTTQIKASVGSISDTVMLTVLGIAATPITVNVSSLALASGRSPINGLRRSVTIRNTYTETVKNIAADLSGKPSDSGVTQDATNCAVVAAGADCVLYFIPGNTQLPSTNVSIHGDNTSTVNISLIVLDYGSEYQGGYVFALSPQVADGGSKVAAKVDNGMDIWWWNGSYVTTGATSNTDGRDNTAKIAALQGLPSNDVPYAAQVCADTDASFNDWYLPAICEINSNIQGTSCNMGMQNIHDNLFKLIPPVGGLNGYYWSSTEDNTREQQDAAWASDFTQSSRPPLLDNKSDNSQMKIRCVRIITE